MWAMKKYNHLGQQERELVFLYHNQGKSNREIEKLIDRNQRTIARELIRNSRVNVKTKVREYSPSLAQVLAGQRRKESKAGLGKLDNPVLQNFVIKRLGKNWSPEQIAGRLKLKAPNLSVSHETVYQFIYAKDNKKLKLWELLRKRHRQRRLFGGIKSRRVKQIQNRVFIEQRPQEVNLKTEVGHWETDNMEGIRKTKDCVSACVERKTYLVKLDKLTSKKAALKENSLIDQLEPLPDDLVKTITFDNGTENFKHQEVGQRLNCQTYFCHPYHSWEKGIVENTIGLVRQYLPKKTDLSKVGKTELNWIAWQLNNRPRKKLNYYTPSEVFYKETGWVT